MTAECAQALTGSRVGAAAAAQQLDDMFGGGDNKRRTGDAATTVVVVDEMDLLLNRNQHVRAQQATHRLLARMELGHLHVALIQDEPAKDLVVYMCSLRWCSQALSRM